VVDELLRSVSGGLDLDDVARGLWEAALPHLPAAVEGEDAEFLAAVEEVARAAGLVHSVPVASLLHACNDGCRQLCARLERDGTPQGQTAARRLSGLKNVALTRIATGYCSGLEETLVMLGRTAEAASRTDVVTGAMKPSEIADQLALEVERCQRMDLSLGLIEMTVRPPREEPGSGDHAADAQALGVVGACLHGCLRRYDSIGMTATGDFLLVLPDISRRGLAGAAERLRREVGACIRGQVAVPVVFALSHYDYVDVNAGEIMHTLGQSLDEARSVGHSLAWS
jgi:GGDEF domain-containing protein